MDYKQAQKHIRAGQIPAIIYIYGQEEVLKTDIIAKVKKKTLGDKGYDINCYVFDGIDIDEEQLFMALRATPMFFGNKIVLIKNADEAIKQTSLRKQLEALLEEVPSNTCVLLRGHQKPDKRLKLVKSIEKKGWLVICDTPGNSELARWVLQKAKRSGKTISKTVVHFLVENAGDSFLKLRQETEKCLLYAADDTEVTNRHVEAVVSPSLEVSIFSYVDALGLKSYEQAWEVLQNILQQGEPPLRVFTMIVRQVRILLMISLLRDKMGQAEMARELKLRPFIVKKCFEQLRNYFQGELEELLKRLCDLEGQMKTGKIDHIYALELFTLSVMNS